MGTRAKMKLGVSLLALLLGTISLGLAGAAGAEEISGNLGAHPFHAKGKAPVKFIFRGKLQVKGVDKKQPVTVAYSFAFSDGSTRPGGQFTFNRDGARQVQTSWTFGQKGDKGDGWCELKISAPQERSICKANFSYEFK
jgi:hypothetical protein